VRVRLNRIEEYDLNLFEFDYDLTMMIFFLDSQGKKILARYGQRTPRSADALQTLEGLHYTMKSALAMHTSESPVYAPRFNPEPKYTRDIVGARASKGCFHCHNVRESLNTELKRANKWSSESVWHFPMPENIGVSMEVNRGNMVASVKAKSAAAEAGLQQGDRLLTAAKVPVHSIADLQFALEHTPDASDLALTWKRNDKDMSATLKLATSWRKGDLSWRPSMQRLVPTLALVGKDLTADEKKSLGLDADQMAFKQRTPVGTKAAAAGFEPGDIILGIDEHVHRRMNDTEFFYHLQREYIVGDEVRFAIIREGKRKVLTVKMR
jgi:hypothetical protein